MYLLGKTCCLVLVLLAVPEERELVEAEKIAMLIYQRFSDSRCIILDFSHHTPYTPFTPIDNILPISAWH